LASRGRETSPGCHAAEERDERAAPHSITSSARASSVGGTSRPSAVGSRKINDLAEFCRLRDRQVGRFFHRDLNHLAKDRLHVCLRKRSQRLRANISKRATAQSKRSHGNVIWCLDNGDDVVLA
jgi:hypothetical protein